VTLGADTPQLETAVSRPRAARRWIPGDRSEDALTVRVRAGDHAAFDALYDAYHRRLLAFCRHMLGSREEAEDAVQHTFLSAYRCLQGGYDVVDAKPWLYTVARNRCVSVLRARRDEIALEHDPPATEGLAAEVEHRADLRMLVRDIQRLPPDQRAALVLFEVGDHSHREIAAVLGVRREKVKALVFQAREALMGWRAARETPCAHIREQIATLRGGARGRGAIRRHVEQCAACAEFEDAVRDQRAALAIALPVAPALGLRAAVLGASAGGSGAGAAVGVGGAVSAGGAIAGLGAGGIATKVLMVTALIGGAGGAGHAVVDGLGRGDKAAAQGQGPMHAVGAARAAPAVGTGGPAATSAVVTIPPGERGGGGETAAPGQHRAPAAPAPSSARDHGKVAVGAETHGRPKDRGEAQAKAPRAAKIAKPAKAKAPKASTARAKAPKAAVTKPAKQSAPAKASKHPAAATIAEQPAEQPKNGKTPETAAPEAAQAETAAPAATHADPAPASHSRRAGPSRGSPRVPTSCPCPRLRRG
jgi:RNA polymerase sigma factor (sigma-70 family)